MEFGVLGPLRVTSGNQEIELGPHKQRLVLLALLVSPGRERSTDQLIHDLWGEDTPGDPGASLRAYVSNLRKIIEPNRAKGSKPSMLVRRGTGYALSVDGDNVDAAVFERLVTSARDSTDSGEIIQLLEEALGLWRGTAFEDAAYEDFAIAEAARLTTMATDARLRLADTLISAGRTGEALEHLEPAVRNERFNEGMAAQLARALYLEGRQSDALRCIDETRQALLDELGLDPGPELRDMEQRILNHDEDLAAQLVHAPLLSAEVRPVAAVLGLPGRDVELGELVWALDATSTSGDGRVSVVSGPAGVGKSRLLEELAGPAASRDATVAWARCDAGASTLPLWPWSTALRDMLEARSEAEQEELLGPDRDALSTIVAGLGASGAEGSVDEIGRFRVFDAAARVLRRLGAKAPVVWVLEDAHWADEASLELASFVAKRLRGMPILLLVSTRDEGLDEPHIAELRQRDDAQDLRLGPLPPAALAELVTTALGPRDDVQVIADALAERCGGNPFFATQLLRVIDVDDPLGSLGAAAAPDTVAAALVRRLADLPPGADEILTVATSAQSEWGIDVAADVAGVDLDVAIECMEAALSAGLIEEEPDRIGHYRFSHALVRETLANRISLMKTAQMYARIGSQIEARRSNDEPAVILDLARHYCIGAPAGTALLGARWSLQAAPLAIGRFDAARAMQIVLDGRAALVHAPAGAERAELDVLLACMEAEARRRDNQIVAAHGCALEAWDLAVASGSVDLMATAAIQYTGDDRFGPWLGYWFDDHVAARLIVEVMAHPDADRLDHVKQVKLYNQWADALHDGRPTGRANEYTRKALEIARESGETLLIIETLAMRDRAANFRLSEGERLEIAAEMVALSKGSGFVRAELLGRRMALPEAIGSGDLDDIAVQLNEIELLADRADDEAVEFMAAWLPLAVKVFHGDLDGAEAGLTVVAERFAHFPAGPLDTLNLLLTQILRERHQMDLVEEAIRDRLAEQDSPAWRSPLLLIMTEYGRFDEAREMLASMPPTDFTEIMESVLQFMSVCLIAESVAHLGETEKAQVLVDHLGQYRDRLVCFARGMQYHGWVSYYLGRLHTVLGQYEQARDCLEEALEKSTHGGAVIMALRARVALGELAVAQGGAADFAGLAAEARRDGYEAVGVWADRLAGTS